MPLDKKTKVNTDWKDSHLIDIYLLAKQGMSEQQICEVICVDFYNAWRTWKKEVPSIKEAIDRGRNDNKDIETGLTDKGPAEDDTIFDYVYGCLPEELRTLWDEIDAITELDHSKREISHKELKQYTKAYQQVLFIHALCTSRFDYTRAMKKVGLTLKKYQAWLKEDSGFADLVAEVQFHKKNFFENALLDQVQLGETSAIIFCNKTINKDRGYGDKLEVSQDVQVQSTANSQSLDLSKLDLTAPMKRALLEAAKEQRAKRLENE
jgi:hypothetical protein